ncbi:methyltransferase domain-containing protein [Candidatus Bathyarchaeota archaeon]|nr:methyltransferase domain-containing protein [Candidatus Bathyarchaeota archaeon]
MLLDMSVRDSRLGWLQQYILTFLWNNDMYGLEIQRNLRFKGETVGTGQLYPALNKLEENGAIESYLKARVGADRKYYKLTDSGKKMLLDHMRGLLVFFELMGIEHLTERYREAVQMANLIPGQRVIDFSNHNIEKIREEYIPIIGSDGETTIITLDESLTAALEDWINYEKLEKVKIITPDMVSSLPDASFDVAFVLSVLHEDGAEWIPEEASRLLRKGGRLVIADLIIQYEDWRTGFLPKFIPGVSRTGIDPKLLEQRLTDLGYMLEKEETWHGFIVQTYVKTV